MLAQRLIAFPTRFFTLAVIFLALAGVGCGGNKGSADSVSGKVTLGGQAVSGEVVFVAEDGKQLGASPTGPDGSYQIMNAPKGKAQVLVKGSLGAPAGGTKAPTGVKGSEGVAAPTAAGVPPPAKYSQANNGLTVEIKGGQQTHNIELSP